MTSLLRVDGSWPGPLLLTAGWYRARARPWNEAISDPILRLERGGSEFLTAVARQLLELGNEAIYSPALYPTSTNVWRRSGFDRHVKLDIMERPIAGGVSATQIGRVTAEPIPKWDVILEIDRLAFDGFWGMSQLGLQEAHGTNKTTATLLVGDEGRVSGYAIVGVQWATVYLHRIAVRPDESGRGLGAALLAYAINWGNSKGGKNMVLNVRPENQRAKRLYQRMGFVQVGSALEVLRYDGHDMLN